MSEKIPVSPERFDSSVVLAKADGWRVERNAAGRGYFELYVSGELVYAEAVPNVIKILARLRDGELP